MAQQAVSEQHVKIGRLIKNRREALGLTQQELANLIDVSYSAVSRWEAGEVANMGRSKILALADTLRLSPVSIVSGEPVAEVIKTKRVPLLGTIAAGEPVLALEDCSTFVEINGDMLADFCLQVKGDSMIDARICDGDLVFVHSQPVVNNGDIAVVLIDNEATLKRFYKNNGGVILKPENTKYQPKYYSEDDLKSIRILGKAVLFQSKLN